MQPHHVPRGYGATAARLTPDQKVGSSNLSALMFPEIAAFKQGRRTICRAPHACRAPDRAGGSNGNAVSEDRIHDLRIMRPTRYQLRYHRLDTIQLRPLLRT